MSAQVTITQLPAAGAITGTEAVPIVQNGQTVQTTTGAISASPSQTYQYLTAIQTPALPNSRYLSGGTGIGLTDGGAQNPFTVFLNATSGSLEAAGNGIVVKSSGVIVPRTITQSGSGISVTNGDGVSGNPTIALDGLPAALASASGTGLLNIVSGSSIGSVSIVGTADQISVANGNASAGSPTISLASNAVLPGTAAMTLPKGTTVQQPAGVGGQMRFNTDTETFDGYASGTWRQFSLAGGVTSFSAGATGLAPSAPSSGAIVLSGTLNVASGGTGANTLTGYVFGNGTSPMTASATIPTTALSGTVTNAQLANSSVTYNGVTVALGASGTITANTTSTLTIGTGLSGTSFNGSSPVTIVIDSTVATLTGVQTLTNKTINGPDNTLTNIANASLSNSAITINGSSVSLGASVTVTATASSALTIGTGLTGTSYNGSAPVTIAIDSTVATLTGTQTLTNKTIDSPTINTPTIATPAVTGGTINNAVIGATTPAAGTFTSVAMTTGTITTAPTGGTDIVNKDYADSIAAGLNYHQPVIYASTTTLPTYVYNNGASGVGATITAVANGALSLGGGSPTATQRVLVKNEVSANAAYNGVYVVTQAGTTLLPFILTRASDYDTSGTGTNEIDQGDYVLVISGTLASTAWVQQTPLPITVGTTALTFIQFNAPITYSAGTGLNESPAFTFNIANTGVVSGSYGLAASVPTIAINAQGQITSASNTAIAIAATQVTSGVLAIAQGGTNSSATATAGGAAYGTGTAFAFTAAGTAGQVLKSAGAGAPVWSGISGGTF